MNLGTIIQMAGTPAVGCSVLLGIVDIVIRSSLLGGALAAEIYALVLAILIITQIRREKNQGNGQTDKPASKTLQLCRRLRLLLGNCKLNLCHQWSLILVSIRRTPHRIHVVEVLPNNLFGDRVHKSKNVTMPNV